VDVVTGITPNKLQFQIQILILKLQMLNLKNFQTRKLIRTKRRNKLKKEMFKMEKPKKKVVLKKNHKKTSTTNLLHSLITFPVKVRIELKNKERSKQYLKI